MREREKNIYETANVRTAFDRYRKMLFTYIKFMTMIAYYMDSNTQQTCSAFSTAYLISYKISKPSACVCIFDCDFYQLKHIFLRHSKIKHSLFKNYFIILISYQKILEHWGIIQCREILGLGNNYPWLGVLFKGLHFFRKSI